jgi:hypothetical protein
MTHSFIDHLDVLDPVDNSSSPDFAKHCSLLSQTSWNAESINHGGAIVCAEVDRTFKVSLLLEELFKAMTLTSFSASKLLSVRI